jgi:predicted lactoylglutathione lyase
MGDQFWVRPILRVRDVESSVAYYCEKLGFRKGWQHGEGKLICAQVGNDVLDIILDRASVMPKPEGPSVLTFSLGEPEQLGALYRDLQDRGAKILSPPFPVVWQKGTYELDVEDLDGNILIFWGSEPK